MKVEVFFHDATSRITDIKKYDPKELAETLNDTTIAMVVVGDIVTHRSSIKTVLPVEEVK